MNKRVQFDGGFVVRHRVGELGGNRAPQVALGAFCQTMNSTSDGLIGTNRHGSSALQCRPTRRADTCTQFDKPFSEKGMMSTVFFAVAAWIIVTATIIVRYPR